MTKFTIRITDKGVKFYKKIKSFFGKEKLEEVSEKEVFSPLMKSGRLFPDIDNLTLDDILWLKQDFNMKNHLSDFGCKVEFKIDRYEDEVTEKDKKYYGQVSFDGTIKDIDRNQDICSFTINTSVMGSEYKPSKKFYESLFANTYSGIYGSLEDVDKLFDTLSIKDKWECEECGKKFSNRLEFLSHLIETKHYDSILDEYIYDKDVIFVKNSRNASTVDLKNSEV